MILRTILVLMLLLLSSTSNTQEIKGAGAGSCGEWLEDRKENYGAKLHWLQGFLSSYNYYVYAGKSKDGIFLGSDHHAVAHWMDKYCTDHPLNTVFDGAIELVKTQQDRDNTHSRTNTKNDEN